MTVDSKDWPLKCEYRSGRPTLPGRVYTSNNANTDLIWFCMGWNARLDAADELARGIVERAETSVYVTLLGGTQIWEELEPHQNNPLVDHLGLLLGRGTSLEGNLEDVADFHTWIATTIGCNRLHYVGHSQSSSLGAISMGRRVDSMTLLAPYPTPGHTRVRNPDPKASTLYQRVADSIAWGPLRHHLINGDITCPVKFFIAGDDRVLNMHDERVREHCVGMLKEQYKQAEFEVVPDVNHNFNPGRRLDAFNRDNVAGLIEIISDHYLTCASDE